MQGGCNLSFIGLQVDLTQIERRFAKDLFDTFKFPPQDLRHSRKDVNIFHRNDRKPHSLPADEPRAFRYISHSQVPFDQFPRVEAPDTRLDFSVAVNMPA